MLCNIMLFTNIVGDDLLFLSLLNTHTTTTTTTTTITTTTTTTISNSTTTICCRNNEVVHTWDLDKIPLGVVG